MKQRILQIFLCLSKLGILFFSLKLNLILETSTYWYFILSIKTFLVNHPNRSHIIFTYKDPPLCCILSIPANLHMQTQTQWCKDFFKADRHSTVLLSNYLQYKCRVQSVLISYIWVALASYMSHLHLI